ncbi:hypothetical protein LSTR_LSTR015809 [Laodelphax striatellus]|uniref:Carboxylesterase type B domain-containing protein n=1 Tax=Laodelphax striatellus TaxID=195883 RepID=A0A482XQ58_LAOST|nr:hypothetical protein LSTR_LSTR015809 [Laodelphax striatellus]
MKNIVGSFLKTGSRGSAQGNFGLMDVVAGLHWLRENLPAFGGDPERITLMGHGTGAALANYIAVSPVAKGKWIYVRIPLQIESFQDKSRRR